MSLHSGRNEPSEDEQDVSSRQRRSKGQDCGAAQCVQGTENTSSRLPEPSMRRTWSWRGDRTADLEEPWTQASENLDHVLWAKMSVEVVS